MTQSQQRDLGEDVEGTRDHLAAIVDSAGDAILSKSLEGSIRTWNKAAEKLYGYTAVEALGKPVSVLVPDDRVNEVPLFLDQIKRGESIDHHETVRVTKDGRHVPVSLTISPIHDADGHVLGASTIARDISVRKNTDQHLVQMEVKYRALLEAAPDAMVVVNEAGEIVLVNVQAERRFGYHRDELLGTNVESIIPEGFAERLVADDLRSAEDALGQQIDSGIELNGRRKDGSEFPIEIMLSPLKSAEGILVTTAVRDITARRMAESGRLQKVRELSRSNEELAQFAYIASHDLQEPLRMVASYMELLSRRYKGKLDSEADEFIAYAVDGASRMQRLIQDLLTYSRVASKKMDPLEISSEDALQDALDNLRGAIEESDAVVTHDPLPTTVADKGQLIQIFQNLVGNAIKYRSQLVPRVHISAAKDDEKNWTFSVQDNGLGIDSQFFERIFGMFQRLHKREELAGTGIGLAICKKIVERHGGSISVESRAGQGSVFRFSMEGDGKRL